MVKKVTIKRKKRFPTFGVVLLLIGIVWLLQATHKIGNFPWLPSIIIVVAIGLIVNRL